MAKKRDLKSEFSEWLFAGAGESYLGELIKSSAAKVKRRLRKKLAVKNLFPHIEHEDRRELERVAQIERQGGRMVKRCRSRSSAINEILDADAGLRITADDLKKPT